jgi:hypothetical protein
MVLNIFSVLFIIVFIWMIILTYLNIRLTNHYNRLIGNTSKSTLKEILDAIITKQGLASGQVAKIEKQLNALEAETKMHIQKVGFVRFNPFADTGGSQSFTLAFLDGQRNGIVITSLYTRTGGRWYIKHVKDGKGVGLELSKEEQTAISQAKYIIESKG